MRSENYSHILYFLKTFWFKAIHFSFIHSFINWQSSEYIMSGINQFLRNETVCINWNKQTSWQKSSIMYSFIEFKNFNNQLWGKWNSMHCYVYLVLISATTRAIWLVILPPSPHDGRLCIRGLPAPSCGNKTACTAMTMDSVIESWWSGNGCKM